MKGIDSIMSNLKRMFKQELYLDMRWRENTHKSIYITQDGEIIIESSAEDISELINEASVKKFVECFRTALIIFFYDISFSTAYSTKVGVRIDNNVKTILIGDMLFNELMEQIK